MDIGASILHPSFIDPSERDHVVVRGADALSYLHSQIAQDVRGLAVGEASWTLVLEPTGKVVALARVTRTDDQEFTFDIDAEVAEPAPTNEDARIAAGWPRMGHEIVPGVTIPSVTGVVGVAVNFTKGCYPGQELVERMDSRGAEAPSSLRILAIGSDVPLGTDVGHPVVDTSGATIGTITSVGATHALATIKRGHDLGTIPAHLG